MRKQLSFALVLALAVPQSLMAQSASLSEVNESNVYGAPPAASRLHEITELDAQISSDIVQLDLLREQRSKKNWTNGATIILSVAGIAALWRASRAKDAWFPAITNFLNQPTARWVGYPLAVAPMAIAFTLGFKEAARLGREIDEAAQDLREKRARLNQLYQTSEIAE